MKYYQTFEVSGRMSFPVDMLRYDACWPVSQDDVVQMIAGLAVPARPWKVRLAHWIDNKARVPTFDRWSSFLATVDRSSIKTEKRG